MLGLFDMDLIARLGASRSLAGVARAMNVTPSAISQRLQAAEARAEVRLVNREVGHFSLTQEGEFIAEAGRQMLSMLETTRETLAGRQLLVVGRIKVVASFGFGRRYVAPLVASYRAAHPDVVVELTLSERPATLEPSSFDIAFHVGDLDAPRASLNVKKIASNVRIICAAPTYLERRGVPHTVEDLSAHDCIALHEHPYDGALWGLRSGSGGERQVRVKANLATNDGEVARSWAVDGLGLVLRSEWDVADDLRSGRLRRVLEPFTSAAWDVMALLPANNGLRPARVQLFLDHALAELAVPPWHRPPMSVVGPRDASAFRELRTQPHSRAGILDRDTLPK